MQLHLPTSTNHQRKPDGIVSIEHQLEIHINDLVISVENADISQVEVLMGLQYVMDYRIRAKVNRLEPDLMEKLAKALIMIMAKKKGGFLVKKLTQEAQMAFHLFSEFFNYGT
jgi:hypothetical protein